MSEQARLKGFIYDGAFELNFLKNGESVRAFPNAGKGACEIIGDVNYTKTYRVRVGDTVARGKDGEIFVVETGIAEEG